MGSWVEPVVLEGRDARLEPLDERHADGLFAIGTEPSIWDWLSYGPFVDRDDALRFIGRAAETGKGGAEQVFAVIHRPSGRVAGTTRYMNIRPNDLALEIGWTWYGLEFQRTAVNTECKLLLMRHAFETLGANRVQLKTDARNLRSQAAIARLGAVREGVLRQDTIVIKDGYVRDSVYFSVVKPEWPAVKERLESFLQRDVR
jgi:RimJ/RimL family protein N-acetyltransferase